MCSSCLDKFPTLQMLHLPCGTLKENGTHAYCGACLEAMFRASVADTSLFPPRCCNAVIPLASCTAFLPEDLVAQFMEKTDELATPNPTYCSNSVCVKWVPPKYIIAHVAVCLACRHKTCTLCKGEDHGGLCPADEGVQQLMHMAEGHGWKACPRCRNMVELNTGCYHVTYVLLSLLIFLSFFLSFFHT